MGKEFIEAKKERYKRKMDQERLRQLGVPELLDALTEEVNKLLRCECHHDADPPVGTTIFLAIVPNKDRAQVYQGGSMICIGEVDEAGTHELRVLAVQHPVSADVFNSKVREAKDWTGYMKVQLEPLS